MKKILVVVSVALAFFVTGCNGSAEAPPAPVVTVTEQPPAPPAPEPEPEFSEPEPQTQELPEWARDEAFVSAVREQFPELSSVSNEELLTLGYGICDLLERRSPVSVIQFLMNRGIEAEMSGFLMGAATASICPEHAGKVQRFIDKYASPGV